MFQKSILLVFSVLVYFGLKAESIEIIKETNNNYKFYISLTQTEYKKVYNNEVDKESIFKLYKINDNKRARVKVSGRYSLTESKLLFETLYPLGETIEFEAVYFNADKEFVKRFIVPKKVHKNVVETEMIAIYPKKDVLPENILFFHIKFSQPMQNNILAYKYFSIEGVGDYNIENTQWRNKSFWRENNTLLVLMVHPGRVKRGIDMNPLFETGKEYTLRMQEGLLDIYGNLVKANLSKSFSIGKSDYNLPTTFFDEIELEKSETKSPLIIQFSEGMDYLSVMEGLQIYKNNGEQIAGNFHSVGGEDDIYEFVPVNKWQKGKYYVLFETIISDYCKNRLNRKFEITNIEEKKLDIDSKRIGFFIM